MEIIPLFTSHYSICDSILTLSADIFKKSEDGKTYTDKVELKTDSPNSVFGICKFYKEPKPFIVDSEFSGFWEAYSNAKELGIDFVFGIKICICADIERKDEDSLKTESNVIIFLKNTQAYYDILPLFSEASSKGYYYNRRTDWSLLNQYWTDNLSLAIPFYSSFLAKNVLHFNHSAVPSFEKIKPVIFVEDHQLPFDSILRAAALEYAEKNDFPVQETHSVYYNNNDDAICYQTLKCIYNRSTIQKPNLSHFSSPSFSYESYLKRKAS